MEKQPVARMISTFLSREKEGSQRSRAE